MLRIEPAGLFISSIFVLIGIAFVYVWRRGALEWR